MDYALVGYGKMGRAIDARASARGHRRVGIIDAVDPSASSHVDAASLNGAEMAFEFTVPGAAEENLLALLAQGVPTVCGTTGWKRGPELDAAIRSARSGLVVAENFSVGMNLFVRVVGRAASLFGALGLHDPFIHEAHHRAKKDAPSGTARRLSAVVLAADARLDSVQEGNPTEQLAPGALHVSSTRAGVEAGTHIVGFDGEHDLVTMQHRARGREGFALGAVLAAEWLGRRPGLHTFDEFLDEMLAERE